MLSKYTWDLKDKNEDFSTNWEILKHGQKINLIQNMVVLFVIWKSMRSQN